MLAAHVQDIRFWTFLHLVSGVAVLPIPIIHALISWRAATKAGKREHAERDAEVGEAFLTGSTGSGLNGAFSCLPWRPRPPIDKLNATGVGGFTPADMALRGLEAFFELFNGFTWWQMAFELGGHWGQDALAHHGQMKSAGQEESLEHDLHLLFVGIARNVMLSLGLMAATSLACHRFCSARSSSS